MAGVAAMKPLAFASLARQLQPAARRTFATSRPSSLVARARPAPRTAPLSNPVLRQSFKRAYAERGTISPETQQKVKRSGFRVLRWTWRLTYVSTIAAVVYFSYNIYTSRHPNEQEEPDPKKKTLVVLGMQQPHFPL